MLMTKSALNVSLSETPIATVRELGQHVCRMMSVRGLREVVRGFDDGGVV